MHVGVDLAPDDALDDLHDDLTHAGGGLFDGPLTGQRDLDVRVGHDPVVLCLPLRLHVGAHLLRRVVGGGDDLPRLLPGLLEHRTALVVGRLGVGPSLVRRLQGDADLLLTILHRLVEGRKDVLGDQEDEDERDGELDEERAVRQ